jgi:hypothetical protein
MSTDQDKKRRNRMNPWLAEIYGTAGADEIEKTAQVEILNKLAEAEGIDLSQFTPEEIQALAEQVMAATGGQGVQTPQQPQMGGIAPAGGFAQQGQPQMAAQHMMQNQQPQGYPQSSGQVPQQPQMDAAAMQKEAQAKFEEADMLGRVMAHAYTQELEKIASAKSTKTKVAARLTKKASAFEKLAEEHAANILSAVGVDPQTGMEAGGQQQAAQPQQMNQQPAQPQMGQQQQFAQAQQPGGQDQFQQALDTRALEILESNGYNVEAILNQLSAQGYQQ